MSTGAKTPLVAAVRIAERFRDLFVGCYVDWSIAGSIRRGKPEISDVEHVVKPRIETMSNGDLFSTPTPTNLLWRRMDSLVADGTLTKHLYGKVEDDPLKHGSYRWGDKYRGVEFLGMTHEVFTADTDNWGSVLAIRTGPAEFSTMLVMRLRDRYKCNKDGYVWLTYDGVPLTRISVPTERDFFRECGMEWVEPKDRK